jgi:hypothetical protein
MSVWGCIDDGSRRPTIEIDGVRSRTVADRPISAS